MTSKYKFILLCLYIWGDFVATTKNIRWTAHALTFKKDNEQTMWVPRK